MAGTQEEERIGKNDIRQVYNRGWYCRDIYIRLG